MRANLIGRLRTMIFSTLLIQALLFGIAGSAGAAPIFTFDSNAEGWTNQATEPFSVTFAPGEGFGEGEALAISATFPRDSYQIVHDEDSDWPTAPSFFQKITFDVRLVPGVEINPLVTGMQIRDNIGNESNVYLATDFIDLGGGWTRVVMAPTNLFDLPQSHDDVGINLHIGTTSAFENSLVMFIDNIAGVQSVPITVEIDIKPGSDPNSINPRSKVKIPVAIFTTSPFDTNPQSSCLASLTSTNTLSMFNAGI